MADLSPRNLSHIRQTDPHIAEALSDIVRAVNNIGQQTNAAPVGATPPPQPHADLQVVGGNGKFAVTMTHSSPSFRGLTHSIEYDTTEAFSNPQPVHLGPNKTAVLAIGEGPFHFRSASQYPTSGQSEYKYVIGPVSARAGSEPTMPTSQGTGYGDQPYTTDAIPKRA